MSATTALVHRGTSAVRRSTLWWGVGIVALALVSVAFWPSLEGTDSLTELTETSPELMEMFGVQDMSTAAGYLDGQMYALMLPLLLSGLAIGVTTSLTSGDEDAGRLEFLHSLPIARRVLWLCRGAAAVVALAAVVVVTTVVMVASIEPFSLDGVTAGRLAVATLACGVLALFSGAIAFAVGGAGGTRGLAIGASVAVLVAGYLANFLLPLNDSLTWARHLSPWYWAIGSQPVREGPNAWGSLLLLVLSAGLVGAGLVGLDRRDIRSA